MRPESEIQRAIIKRLSLLGYVAVAVPNGAHIAGGPQERARKVAAMKADGMMVGFPDLVIIGKFCVGFMEVKTDKGKLSPAQTMARKILQDKGQKWALVRSQDDAVEALKEWGWK